MTCLPSLLTAILHSIDSLKKLILNLYVWCLCARKIRIEMISWFRIQIELKIQNDEIIRDLLHSSKIVEKTWLCWVHFCTTNKSRKRPQILLCASKLKPFQKEHRYLRCAFHYQDTIAYVRMWKFTPARKCCYEVDYVCRASNICSTNRFIPMPCWQQTLDAPTFLRIWSPESSVSLLLLQLLWTALCP